QMMAEVVPAIGGVDLGRLHAPARLTERHDAGHERRVCRTLGLADPLYRGFRIQSDFPRTRAQHAACVDAAGQVVEVAALDDDERRDTEFRAAGKLGERQRLALPRLRQLAAELPRRAAQFVSTG